VRAPRKCARCASTSNGLGCPDLPSSAAHMAAAAQAATRRSARVASQNKRGSCAELQPLRAGFLLRSGQRVGCPPEQVPRLRCASL